MDHKPLKAILEALLFSQPEGLALDKIEAAFEDWERPEPASIKQALEALQADYQGQAIELRQLGKIYRFQTRPQYQIYIQRLLQERPAKYSRALIETLAIIAYRQPVTRAEIEAFRGVSISSTIMKTLLDRDWIAVTGTRDVPGKPSVYKTTQAFLAYFNLQSLQDLPSIEELQQASADEI